MGRVTFALPTDLFEQEYARVPYMRAMRQVELARDAGHEIAAVEWIRWNLELPEQETRDGVTLNRLFLKPPSSGTLARLRSFRDITRRVSAAIAAQKPDAIVCHDPELLPASQRAASASGAALFYDAHEDFPAMAAEKSWLEAMAFARIEKRGARVAAHTYVVSDGIRERFEAWGARATTIRNSKPLAQTKPSVPREQMRAKLGLQPEDVVIAFTGSVAEERGLHQAIELLPELPNAALVALGGPEPAALALQTRARALGLSRRAIVPGPVSVQEVANHLHASDIGILALPESPRYRHASPNKLFDYMAAGLAMVVSDLPELRRIVVGPGMAVPLAGAGQSALREALAPLVSDAGRRHEMGTRARKAYETVHCWERQAEKLKASHAFWRPR